MTCSANGIELGLADNHEAARILTAAFPTLSILWLGGRWFFVGLNAVEVTSGKAVDVFEGLGLLVRGHGGAWTAVTVDEEDDLDWCAEWTWSTVKLRADAAVNALLERHGLGQEPQALYAA